MRALTAGLGLVALTLLACQPQDGTGPDPAAPTARAEPQPSEVMQQTFSSCEWGRVEGSGLAVWSYACPADFGDVRLVADPALPGFSLEGTQDGLTSRSPAIIVFEKAADADLPSIIDQVRAKSPGPDTATCALEPITGEGVAPGGYAFVPTGDARARWEAAVGGDEMGEAPREGPCGPLGPQIVGDRAFLPITGDSTKVAFVEYGSEIQIFDASTLRPAG